MTNVCAMLASAERIARAPSALAVARGTGRVRRACVTALRRGTGRIARGPCAGTTAPNTARATSPPGSALAMPGSKATTAPSGSAPATPSARTTGPVLQTGHVRARPAFQATCAPANCATSTARTTAPAGVTASARARAPSPGALASCGLARTTARATGTATKRRARADATRRGRGRTVGGLCAPGPVKERCAAITARVTPRRRRATVTLAGPVTRAPILRARAPTTAPAPRTGSASAVNACASQGGWGRRARSRSRFAASTQAKRSARATARVLTGTACVTPASAERTASPHAFTWACTPPREPARLCALSRTPPSEPERLHLSPHAST